MGFEEQLKITKQFIHKENSHVLSTKNDQEKVKRMGATYS